MGARHATAAILTMEDWLEHHDFRVLNVNRDLHSASWPAVLAWLSTTPLNTPTHLACKQFV